MNETLGLAHFLEHSDPIARVVLAVLLVLVAAPRGILGYALLGWDRLRGRGTRRSAPGDTGTGG